MGFVPKVKVASFCISILFGIILYVIIPAIAVYLTSPRKEDNFISSLYFIIISLSTIGFGDYYPGERS